MKLSRILCPVDFSDLSALALRYAGLLARCGGARVTVAYAHSFQAPAYFTEARLDDLNRQFRESVQEAEAALRKFVERELGPQAAGAADFRILEMPPADAIRQAAADSGADMIVMGTHGRSGVNLLLLGSVAERVLRESGIPVLTVRGDPALPLAAPRHILCPVNDTAAAREALRMAAALANCFGAALTALHARESAADKSIPDLCAWVPQEVRSQCAIRELTREGNAAYEIVSAAKQADCDLLVMGATHRRFFDTTVLGSTVARTVRHVPCPVLTVVAPVS